MANHLTKRGPVDEVFVKPVQDNNVVRKVGDTQAAVQKVSAHYSADILIYCGPVLRGWDDFLIDECRKRERRKNVILVLTTLGGDPHAAYRIARCLRQYYAAEGQGEVIIFVPSVCASAGTLITLAADRLVLSDHAELGPLDMQMRKPDEVGERTSGLTPIQALSFLEGATQKLFKMQFEGLRFSRTLSFSTRMAADISAQLATGMLSNLYEQIDPLRLAEYDRAMRIAYEYGERIKTANVKQHALKQLLEGYPSHEFCIDPVESKELFHKIEKPEADLEALGDELKALAEKYLQGEAPAVLFINEPETPNSKVDHENQTTLANGAIGGKGKQRSTRKSGRQTHKAHSGPNGKTPRS